MYVTTTTRPHTHADSALPARLAKDGSRDGARRLRVRRGSRREDPFIEHASAKTSTIKTPLFRPSTPFSERYKLETIGTQNPDFCVVTSDNFAFPISRATLEAHATKDSDVFDDLTEEVIDLNGSAVSLRTIYIKRPAAQVRPLLLHISPLHYEKRIGLPDMLSIYELSHDFDMEFVLDAMRDRLR